MNKLALLLCFLGLFSKAQDSLSVSVSNWKDNKKAAIIFTFDDWSPGHGTIVYPLFKKHKLQATFFVTLKNHMLSGGYRTMKKAYADGFEIGNHTQNHSNLTQIDSLELEKEIIQAQKILREKVHPKCANTFAFPYGAFNKDVLHLTKSTHIGARTAGLPYGRMWDYSLTYGKTDYFQLQTFMARDIHTPNTFSKLTKSAIKQGGMIVFMYHSIFGDYVDDHWFGAINENLLEAQLKAVKNHEDSVWITTFEKAIMYHKEKANVKINTAKVDGNLEISLTSDLNQNQFFEPITVCVDNIDPNQVKTVKLNSKTIPHTSLKSGLGIKFNSLPYNAKIIVEL